jgi:hypothetical protein
VFDAFWNLDRLPIDEVRDALAPWVGPDPDRHRLDAATCLARGIPAPPLRLRTLSATKDADVLDLGPIAEEQLRLAGMKWDGVDRAPEERLDGELEGSFAGTLEHRVLGDSDAPEEPPLFDVLLFAEDAGVVFAAGTTRIVALIAYRKVEMRDRRARLALEQAIAAPTDVAAAQPVDEPRADLAPAEEPEASGAASSAIVEERTERKAKKRAVTKGIAEKTVAKKPAAKKAPAKRTAAKKPRTTSAAGKKNVKTAPGKTKAARKSETKSSRGAR